MKKIFNNFKIADFAIVCVLISVVALVSVFVFLVIRDSENSKIENKNVKIEYIENSKGDYTVIVKAKNNTNFQVSETIEKGENKKATVLNGLNVENYRYNWKADLEPLGIKYQWETNKEDIK